MGNLLDYLDWRGDLTFDLVPFGEIDGIILSCMSYVDLDNIVPGPGEGEIDLAAAATMFQMWQGDPNIKRKKTFISWAPDLLLGMAVTKRYEGAVLKSYVSKVDEESELQFSAIEVVTSDGISFISFRGTDDTLIGWKEDFNMSYRDVPADKAAVAYLNQVQEDSSGAIRIGGHSKGGHLAVYAAAFCRPEIRSRIQAIYDLDGPGVRESIYTSPELYEVAGRIHRYLPEESVIGMLLEHHASPVILKSNEIGLMQHNPLSWQLMGNRLETVPSLGKAGTMFDAAFRQWIHNIPEEERHIFIDDIFDLIEACGADNLSDLPKKLARAPREVLEQMENFEPETKEIYRMLWKSLFEQLVPVPRRLRKIHKKSIANILLDK